MYNSLLLATPCELLAEHWDEVFDRYPWASHWFQCEIRSVSESSACALCRLFARAPIVAEANEYGPSSFGVYMVNLLGERERLAADNYSPEHYIMGLTVSVGDHRRPLKHLKGLSRRNHRHGTQGLIVPAIKQGDGHEYRSPYMARLIDSKQVDFGLLRQWINKCQTDHTDCQPPPRSIDQLCDDPWAVSAAPRTVRDAMDLTLKLGFRYLWVDRSLYRSE